MKKLKGRLLLLAQVGTLVVAIVGTIMLTVKNVQAGCPEGAVLMADDRCHDPATGILMEGSSF